MSYNPRIEIEVTENETTAKSFGFCENLRDLAKEHGFRWNAQQKVWFLAGANTKVAGELLDALWVAGEDAHYLSGEAFPIEDEEEVPATEEETSSAPAETEAPAAVEGAIASFGYDGEKITVEVENAVSGTAAAVLEPLGFTEVPQFAGQQFKPRNYRRIWALPAADIDAAAELMDAPMAALAAAGFENIWGGC